MVLAQAGSIKLPGCEGHPLRLTSEPRWIELRVAVGPQPEDEVGGYFLQAAYCLVCGKHFNGLSAEWWSRIATKEDLRVAVAEIEQRKERLDEARHRVEDVLNDRPLVPKLNLPPPT